MPTDDPLVWLRENIRTLPGEPGLIADALIDVAEAVQQVHCDDESCPFCRASDALDAAIRREMKG